MKTICILLLVAVTITLASARGRRTWHENDETEASIGRHHGRRHGWGQEINPVEEEDSSTENVDGDKHSVRSYWRRKHSWGHKKCGDNEGNWTMEGGVKFPPKNESSYSKLSYLLPTSALENANISQFYIEFKTEEKEGLLFIQSSKWRKDFLSLYLEDRELNFGFNNGQGAVSLKTEELALDDGNWHSVNVSRSGTIGELWVDAIKIGEVTSPSEATRLDAGFKVYVGAACPKMMKGRGRRGARKHGRRERSNPNIPSTPFVGCIRNFKMFGQLAADPIKQCGLVACDGR